MRDDDTTHAEHAFNEALKLTGGALDKAQKYLKKESFGTQSARVGKAAKPAHPPDAHFAEDLRENDDLFANPAMHT